MSGSICGQGQAEWWGLVVIIAALIVVGWLVSRGSGCTFTKDIQ